MLQGWVFLNDQRGDPFGKRPGNGKRKNRQAHPRHRRTCKRKDGGGACQEAGQARARRGAGAEGFHSQDDALGNHDGDDGNAGSDVDPFENILDLLVEELESVLLADEVVGVGDADRVGGIGDIGVLHIIVGAVPEGDAVAVIVVLDRRFHLGKHLLHVLAEFVLPEIGDRRKQT